MSSDMFELLLTIASEGAERVGEGFDDPDDDWAPMAMVSRADGTLLAVGIDPRFMANDGRKDMLAEEMLPAILREQEATAIVLLTSTWYVDQSRRDAAEHGFRRPSQDPNRKEAVTLMGLSLTEQALWMADIERHEDAPPTLGEWRKLPDKSVTEITGRFVIPVRQALAHQG